MKAVCAIAAGGPEVLKVIERERPRPGANELLVRVHAAGVNRPDVAQREGRYPPPPGASDILGLEFAGTVEAVGPKVSRFGVGDAVMALVAGGAYAEWCVVHEANALPVPTGMSMTHAAGIPETYFTVWSNLFQRAGLSAGETVLIHGGASGIGTTAIQLAKLSGARVITTVGSADKVGVVTKLGADIAINYKSEDFVYVSRQATDGRGPDVILDMVGGAYLQRNIDLIAIDGRIAQIAFMKGSRSDLELRAMLMKRITSTGSTLRARSVEMKAIVARALEESVLPWLTAGKAWPVIDSTFPLADVAKAHARIDTGLHVGKVVLTLA